MDLGLTSLISNIGDATKLGDAVNSATQKALGWTSLVGSSGPAQPATPAPAPNGILPSATSALKGISTSVVVGGLSVLVLIILAVRRR